ncbi:DUF4174 domain-containing protein [uncultured Tateyamaria sp.]|uniref:DUF4174 domain-containing protein n=1 Tax=uncultured Tateyamaria sp. TaxID=455651 RepID=UPI002629E3E2|nr:DUF4174 domain-containing protein [uncultured Tateyamaria sp.]
MKQLLPIVLASFFGVAAQAADEPGAADPFVYVDTDVSDLTQFVWEKRPIIVFADSPNDPNFSLQMEYLRDRADDLAERDVVVLVDTDPQAVGPLREKLRPRGFMLVLIGKDGGVKLRKPFPWDVRELSRTIDKMPMRQREIRDRRVDPEG